MKSFFLTLLISILPLAAFAQKSLPRSTPERMGVNSSDLTEYVDQMMSYKHTTMHGIMVLRHGNVIAEAWNAPFKSSYGHTLYSASKTFTAVAVGLCVEDGLLHLDDPVASFFAEEIPDDLDPNSDLHKLTVEHLLTMQSGLPVKYTTLRKDSVYWTRALLSQTQVAEPGTLFAYDSMDTYLLSALVQRVSGQTVLDLLNERVFSSIGIKDAAWERSPEGVSCGGWGLYLKLEDMAKFGQLLLQKGKWDDRQLVDSMWVESMMEQKVESASGQRYGYQMWMTSRSGTVKADGAYGQYIFVIPDKDMVVAVFQNQHAGTSQINPSSDEFAFLNALLRKVNSDKAIPTGVDASKTTKKQQQYHVAYTNGTESSAKHMSLYTIPLTVQLGGNILGWETVTMSQTRGGDLKLAITDEKRNEYTITCGHQKWKTGKIKGTPLTYADRQFKGQFSGIDTPFYVSASFGWYGSSNDDLYVRLHYVNWISGCRIHFQFTGNVVSSVKVQLPSQKSELSIPVLQCQ